MSGKMKNTKNPPWAGEMGYIDWRQFWTNPDEKHFLQMLASAWHAQPLIFFVLMLLVLPCLLGKILNHEANVARQWKN